jgi:hypothetical protein
MITVLQQHAQQTLLIATMLMLDYVQMLIGGVILGSVVKIQFNPFTLFISIFSISSISRSKT